MTVAFEVTQILPSPRLRGEGGPKGRMGGDSHLVFENSVIAEPSPPSTSASLRPLPPASGEKALLSSAHGSFL